MTTAARSPTRRKGRGVVVPRILGMTSKVAKERDQRKQIAKGRESLVADRYCSLNKFDTSFKYDNHLYLS